MDEKIVEQSKKEILVSMRNIKERAKKTSDKYVDRIDLGFLLN